MTEKIRYLDVADFLAESALHAPQATFGDVEFYPECVFHANRSANTPACRSPIPLMPITLGAKRRSGGK